ncbi:MAG: response regulator [Magnetococcales bacterium]|nr:response regulator [Magnetococcales bacterium]
MIKDRELRNLFRSESTERLEKLGAGLLQLEQNPQDSATIQGLLRDAHSLKGAARMLGVSDVEKMVHCFEEVLRPCFEGRVVINRELADRLNRGLTDVETLIQASITGKESTLSVQEATNRLRGLKPIAREHGTLQPPSAPETEPTKILGTVTEPTKILGTATEPTKILGTVTEPTKILGTVTEPTKILGPVLLQNRDAVEVVAETSVSQIPDKVSNTREKEPRTPAEGATTGESVERIRTMRVDADKLDRLLSKVGELLVVRNRVRRRLEDVNELIAQWGLLQRQGINQRRNLDDALRPMEHVDRGLENLRRELFEDNTILELVVGELEEGIWKLRLMSLFELFRMFPRMVREMSRQQGKDVRLVQEGIETTVDKHIVEALKDPLTHLVRNALDHGLEAPGERMLAGKPPQATLWLKGRSYTDRVEIEVADDGKGLNTAAIFAKAQAEGLLHGNDPPNLSDNQLITILCTPGFTTAKYITDISGRGIGMNVVREQVEQLNGQMQLINHPGHGCRFILSIPNALSSTPVFIVSLGKQRFVIPMEYVQLVRRVSLDAIFRLDGRDTLDLDEKPVAVSSLERLLGLPDTVLERQELRHRACIILQVGSERLGLLVDELVDQQKLVLKPYASLLRRVPNVSGSTILGTGEVCMVLSAEDLLATAKKGDHPAAMASTATVKGTPANPEERSRVVLLVEDSITTRVQEKRILEGAGYQVITAVNGKEALEKLSQYRVDAVVSDVEMPEMDGLMLTEKIRASSALKKLPVILVTSRASPEDQQNGLIAGANAYLTKSGFQQDHLIQTLRRLT